MGFRSGVLIGGLVMAVVALGVAVIILATDDDSSDAARTETVAQVGSPCQLESMGGEVEVELGADEISCAEARGIYAAFREAVQNGDAEGIGRPSEVEGWSCEEYPLAKYPLIVRCRKGTLRFDVVGLAPSAHPDQGPAPSPSQPARPVIFQTPSGNIGCQLGTTAVRCDIFERSWSPPPRPGDCEYSWGHSIELQRGGPTFLCTNDAVISPGGESEAPILRYGEAAAHGQFTCESREQALVCAAKSGHGFLLSIQKLRMF